jgi:cupin 2 domain-containing protein
VPMPLTRGQLFEGYAREGNPGEGKSSQGELGEGKSSVAATELVTELIRGEGVRIERIVSFGQCSAEGFWYDQEEDEFVVLLSGAAELEFERGESVQLRPGEWIDIRAHVRHRVKWTTPDEATVWLAVFRAARRRPI